MHCILRILRADGLAQHVQSLPYVGEVNNEITDLSGILHRLTEGGWVGEGRGEAGRQAIFPP